MGFVFWSWIVSFFLFIFLVRPWGCFACLQSNQARRCEVEGPLLWSLSQWLASDPQWLGSINLPHGSWMSSISPNSWDPEAWRRDGESNLDQWCWTHWWLGLQGKTLAPFLLNLLVTGIMRLKTLAPFLWNVLVTGITRLKLSRPFLSQKGEIRISNQHWTYFGRVLSFTTDCWGRVVVGTHWGWNILFSGCSKHYKFSSERTPQYHPK
jgi:hypothetical protein